MLPERDRTALEDMLAHAREAIEAAQGRRESDLQTDRLFCLAVQHLLAILGEAAGRVSAPTRASLAHIPWGQVIGMRNRLVHGYDSVRADRVWATITLDLPALVHDLETALAPEQAPGGDASADPPRDQPTT